MKFVLLGDPVAQSKSPIMHAAAFRALGLDHTYEAVRVREDEIRAWTEKLRAREIGGINVTVPHKRAAMNLADEIDPIARACNACNVLALRGDRVVAFDTDVPALIEELRDQRNGGTAIVIGNGGAARAAREACRVLGVTRVITRARREGDEPLVSTGSERDARFIIQATSAGMIGADPGDEVARAIDFSIVPKDARVLDVIYAPRETPFLAGARKAGIPAKNGLGMLARQGAIALELWLSIKAPLDVMLAAIQ